MNLKKVIACIKKNKKFLITTHVNPEGDALGSELALYLLLKKLGKEAVIINEDPLPYGYDFLPGVRLIQKRKHSSSVKFDCFVILDCSDMNRCGGVSRLRAINKAPVLNIDHHVSNNGFGDVNWVDPAACSCSQQVYYLYKHMRIPFDSESALLLYVGILTDTGSFRYPNTTGNTHTIAAELLGFGLDIAKIYKDIYGNIPYYDMKLLTQILGSMRRDSNGKIIWFEIRKKMLKHKKISFDLSENLLNFARSVKGGEVAILFKENLDEKNKVRVNLRSQGKADVNKIASFFGGGGHRTASGFTMIGRIAQIRRMVLNKVCESLK